MIGNTRQLADLLATNKYDEIAITLRIQEFFKLEKIVATCEKSGIHTKFIPDYNHIIPTKPYTEDLDGIPVIHVRHVPLSSSFNNAIKRIVDLFWRHCGSDHICHSNVTVVSYHQDHLTGTAYF